MDSKSQLQQSKARLETRVRQQAAVADLGRYALRGTALHEVMDRAAEAVAEALGVDLCKVLELRPEKNDLLLRAGVGWQGGLVGEATVPADTRSQAGYTLERQGPVITQNLSEETRFSGLPLLTEHGVVSGIERHDSGRRPTVRRLGGAYDHTAPLQQRGRALPPVGGERDCGGDQANAG